MRFSVLPSICALVVPSLSLPGASSEVERRQTVNEPWYIGNWAEYNGTSNVRFLISARDAYIGGFYGFAGWCDPIQVNFKNSTVCFSGGDQWRVETKVTFDKTTNHTGVWVKHTQVQNGKTVTATGTTDNFIPDYPAATLWPTSVEGL